MCGNNLSVFVIVVTVRRSAREKNCATSFRRRKKKKKRILSVFFKNHRIKFLTPTSSICKTRTRSNKLHNMSISFEILKA